MYKKNEQYSWFEDPEYAKKQQALLNMNKLLGKSSKAFHEDDAFDTYSFGKGGKDYNAPPKGDMESVKEYMTENPFDSKSNPFVFDSFLNQKKNNFQPMEMNKSIDYEPMDKNFGYNESYVSPLSEKSLTAGNDFKANNPLPEGMIESDSGLSDSISETPKGEGFVDNYGAMIGAGAGMIGDTLKSQNKREYSQTGKSINDKVDEPVGKTKDAVASVFGPFAQLFRGVEKLGNAAGDSMGGEAGAVVSGGFSPDEAIMKNNMDPDVKTGDKILGMLLPFHAALTHQQAENSRMRKARAQQKSEDHIKLEQEQRQKDGLEALENLRRLREQQIGYI